MIDPTQFPHVEEALCNISRNKGERIEALYSHLSIVTSEMAELSLNSRGDQGRRDEDEELYSKTLELRAEMKKILKDIDTIGRTPEIVIDETVIATRKNEFINICKLPQVINAWVNESGEVNFVLHARYIHKGTAYDLGDWTVRFGDQRRAVSFQVVRSRTGLKSSWDKGYPNYTLPGPLNEFCLGDNTDLVTTLFDTYRFFFGVQLVALLICSINAGEENLVPLAFRTETKEEAA